MDTWAGDKPIKSGDGILWGHSGNLSLTWGDRVGEGHKLRVLNQA